MPASTAEQRLLLVLHQQRLHRRAEPEYLVGLGARHGGDLTVVAFREQPRRLAGAAERCARRDLPAEGFQHHDVDVVGAPAGLDQEAGDHRVE
jgi:hypothetical protein